MVMRPPYLDVHSAPIEKVREYEIEEARNMQQAMVPTEPLRAHPVEFACKFRPVTEVGGDFLDYFWLPDRRLGFYLGDVVGKGLAAAMYAALAIGTFRGIHKTGMPPTSVLELLNERLRMRVLPGRYCAVQYAVFDPPSWQLWFANAGLPLPLHISSAGCCELGEGGLPSGMFAGARYTQHTVRLASGDAVLFTTDGLLDARNREGEEFGIERLIAVCAENKNKPAEILLGFIFAAVELFSAGAPQQDDMTAAVLKLA